MARLWLRLGFLRAEKGDVVDGGQGGTGGAFYRLGRCPWRAGHAETVRATRGRGGLGRVLPAHEEGDDPDMRASRGSGGEREGGGVGRVAGWAGEGKRKGKVWAENV